jgi:hypothetical protein
MNHVQLQANLDALITRRKGDGNTILREHNHRRGKGHREMQGVTVISATVGAVQPFPSDAWNRTEESYSSLFGVLYSIYDVAQNGQIGDCYLLGPMAMLALGALMGASGKPLSPKDYFAPVAGQPNQVAVTLYRSGVPVTFIVALAFDALQQGGLATTNTWSKILEITFAALRTAAGTEAGLNSGWFTEAFDAFNVKVFPGVPTFMSASGSQVYPAVRAALQAAQPLAIFWGSGSGPTNGYPGNHAWAVMPESWQVALANDGTNILGWNPWGPGITEDPNKLPAPSLPPNGTFAACYGVAVPAPNVQPKPSGETMITTTLATDKQGAAPGEPIAFTWTCSVVPAQLFLLIPGFPAVELPPSLSGTKTVNMPQTTAKSVQFQLYWIATDGTKNYGAQRAMDVTAGPVPTPTPTPAPSPTPTPTPTPSPVVALTIDGVSYPVKSLSISVVTK